MVKVDGRNYRVLGEKPVVYETVLPTAEEKGYELKFSETSPAEGWNAADFDDTNWKTGKAPFTDHPEAGGTLWRSKNIWTRRIFERKTFQAGWPAMRTYP